MPALLNTTAPVQLTAWAANTTAGESRKRRPQEAAAGAAAKRQPAKDSLPDATIYRKRYTKAELLETATALVERHNQGSAPQELQMLADNALAAYAITPLSVAVHQINTSALVDKKSAGRYRGRDTGLEFLRLVDEYYKKTRHGHLADAEMFLEMLAYLRNKYTR